NSITPPPSTPPFPYTTLFRSLHADPVFHRRARGQPAHGAEQPSVHAGRSGRDDRGGARLQCLRQPSRPDSEPAGVRRPGGQPLLDRKSTRLNSSHVSNSYAVI